MTKEQHMIFKGIMLLTMINQHQTTNCIAYSRTAIKEPFVVRIDLLLHDDVTYKRKNHTLMEGFT